MNVELSQRSRIALFYLAFTSSFLFGLGALTLLPVAGAAAVAVIERAKSVEIDDVAVERIYHLRDWNAATAARHVVLFVDCDWSIEVVSHRRLFVEFARSLPATGNLRAMTVKLDCYDRDELWEAIEDFWRSNNIELGGLQTLNGAGRIVWLRDGGVVDYCWAWEEKAPADLEARTAQAFRDTND